MINSERTDKEAVGRKTDADDACGVNLNQDAFRTEQLSWHSGKSPAHPLPPHIRLRDWLVADFPRRVAEERCARGTSVTPLHFARRTTAPCRRSRDLDLRVAEPPRHD